MPPALFTVGTLDCLIDDSLFVAERGERPAIGPRSRSIPKECAFNVYPTGLARQANARQFEFLRNSLSYVYTT
jgi:hypothetical protein